MSRSRNIKPGFFKNDLLAELAFEYRILFQGLWCESDRDGKLEDRPKRIKGEIFPYDDVDVNEGLNLLQEHGFIVRYKALGKSFIKILAFSKHQNPHKKEALSCIPDPDCGEHGASPVQVPEIPDRAGLIPDSPFLIPDSVQEHSVQPLAARSRFDDFWTVYPNKKGRQPAEKKWAKEKLDGMADSIIAHVFMMKSQDDGWRRGYAPMGSTYLNQARWTDVPQARPIHSGSSFQASEPVRRRNEL